MPASGRVPSVIQWLLRAALFATAVYGRSPARASLELETNGPSKGASLSPSRRGLFRSETPAEASSAWKPAALLESFGEIDRDNLRQMLDEAMKNVKSAGEVNVEKTQEMLDEFVQEVAEHPSGRSLLPWLRDLGTEGLVQLVQTSHELGSQGQEQRICKAATSVTAAAAQPGEYVRPAPSDPRYAANRAALPLGRQPAEDDGFILLQKDESSAAPSAKFPADLEGWRPKFTFQDVSDESRGLRGKWGEFGQEYAAFHPYWMKQHPSYVESEKDADIIFAIVHPLMPYTRSLARIPPRSDGKKYIVWGYSLHEMRFDTCLPGRGFDNTVDCQEVWKVMDRKDLLYLLYDLRDPFVSDNVRAPLPGVTVFPPMQMQQIDHAKVADIDKPTKYQMTVRCNLADIGWHNSSHVRDDLAKAFKGNTDPRIAVEDSHAQMACLSQTDHSRYSDLMMNTSFALCPHGDQRWSYRFSEALKACAIPVVMADGMTMPLEEVIDWKEAAIQVPESYASSKEKLLSALPKDQATINRMRKRVCEIYDKYMSVPIKQFDASLVAIGKKVRSLSG
eukprot:TRINITY_DN122248_c0_g1_i1.p1 TRINITY_DN122248_c0_g1~~TRINITY_DN122248_c0_g1_i1.p1  ORF type:complete len:563 (+),score=138.68 TRINITY_DN122248_c0_g1_i1:78-1766(+)